MSGAKRYAVEVLMMDNSWEDIWLDENEKPLRFATREEAEAEIAEHVQEMNEAGEAGEAGDLDDAALVSDYRVVEVREGAESSQTAHTPGPWCATGNRVYRGFTMDRHPCSKFVASCDAGDDYSTFLEQAANAIHSWFVKNVQDGTDDCSEYPVSEAKLHELLSACTEVRLTPGSAQSALPTQDGFFFGGTEYDEFYVEDVRYTAEVCKRILDDPELFKTWSVYYRSSW